MKTLSALTTLAGLTVLSLPARAGGSAIDTSSRNALTLAIYGDSPYGTSPTDTAEVQASPAFIEAINEDPHVGVVVHVGDIHSGKQYCTQAYDESIYELWTAFEDPLVYTPGDNEWTDCHKVGEGGGTYDSTTGQIKYVLDSSGNPVDYAGGDPLANLNLVRSIFFASPGSSLGGHSRPLLTQAQVFDPSYPSDAKYVENVIWAQSQTLFVTINLPGGSNNDNDIWYGAPSQSPAQVQEISERTGADLRWLDTAFALAGVNQLKAVVIVAQADMWDPEKGPAHQTQYEPFIASIAAHATSFGNPVMMFNGDSHSYLSDNPLSPADPLYYMHPYYSVPNFHRIVVHGSTFPLEYLRVTIDPRGAAADSDTTFGGIFSWQRVTP